MSRLPLRSLLAPPLLALFAGCAAQTMPPLTPQTTKAPETPVVAPVAAPAPAPPAAPKADDWIVKDVLGAIDKSADPCQDFYQYACGNWLKTETRPADRARWTRSFSVIDERNRALIRTVLEDSAANPGSDPDRLRVGSYYGACMDEAAIEGKGTQPLDGTFLEIAAAKDFKSLFALAGKMQLRGMGPFLGIGVFPDFKDPGTDIAFFFQGGLGLPDRDYYVSDDAKKKELVTLYEKHIAAMFALSGEKPGEAAKAARAIVAFETELAKVSRKAEEMREIDKLYNKLDLAGVKKLSPSLPWEAFLAAAGAPGATQINVATPEFFTALEKLLPKTPVSTLRSYLRWNVLQGRADQLPKAFVDEKFAFFGRTLSGQEQIEARWKRCVDDTAEALGFALGKVYVEKAFPGESKAKALEMIHDIEAAFEGSLPRLAWMDDTTRQRALEKKNAVGNKIGYPDVWRDYSAMRVGRDDYFGNADSAAEFETRRQTKKIGQPVDRTEWGMVPQQVNAYYNPLMNEIVFPAGILQPPFFHRDFPAAMNYGSIGMVVGHELSHGFDDSGRKFDAKGEMREWWAPEVSARFESQADCLRDQYSKFEAEPGLFLNGKLTAGENIADNGGLKQAFEAYKLWRQRSATPDKEVPGLTPDQLFYVAFAQGWCTLATPESDRVRVTTDSHSLPRFRVLGPVTNNAQFAEAFRCAPGTPMNPVAKCVVW